jgi:MazG family protein
MKNTSRLLQLMAKLRDPEQGCPWDRKQDFSSLIPYLLEEAYEVVDAIEREDYGDLKEELGDLLLQIAFHSQLASERGLFDFESVAEVLCDKLTRRHPHVFAGAQYQSDAQRATAWEQAKATERLEKQKVNDQVPASVLAGVATSLPALMHADKLQRRAARHGFDWQDVSPVFDKVQEELDEVRAALESGNQEHIVEEIGDLLFVAVNLARHLGVEPETALKAGSRKFTKRFQYIEKRINEQCRALDDCALAELDALWDEAKAVLPKS